MKLRKKLFLRLLKIKYNKNIHLEENVDFWKTRFGGFNTIGKNTELSYSKIGKLSYTGKNCILNKVEIGDFCSIGNDVKIVYGMHPINDYFSTHPAFYSIKKQANITYVKDTTFDENRMIDENTSVRIGNDVWIASDVKILEGVNIGNGSIIATGAVVTKNVEPYSIVGGVPAKLIKYRFEEKKIIEIMSTKWWENDLDWFKKQENIDKLNKLVREPLTHEKDN